MTMNVNPYRLAARYHTFNVTFNPLTFLHNDPKISSKSLPTILTFLPKNLFQKNLLYSPRTRNPQPQLTLKILCCGEKNLCPSRAQIKERRKKKRLWQIRSRKLSQQPPPSFHGIVANPLLHVDRSELCGAVARRETRVHVSFASCVARAAFHEKNKQNSAPLWRRVHGSTRVLRRALGHRGGGKRRKSSGYTRRAPPLSPLSACTRAESEICPRLGNRQRVKHGPDTKPTWGKPRD